MPHLFFLIFSIICYAARPDITLADVHTAPPAASKIESDPSVEEGRSKTEIELDSAKRRFEEGNIEEARKVVQALENQIAGMPKVLATRTMLLLVRVAYAFDDTKQGEQWLEKIFAHDPSTSLDPLVFPPEAIRYWKQLTQVMAAPAEATSAVQEDEPDTMRRNAQFWVGLFPFGIGHFDAGQYERGLLHAGTEFLSLYTSPYFRGLETFSPPFTESRNQHSLPDVVAGMTFTGAWAYEIMDMMPILLARDAHRANWVRWGLSFAPFGAAQYKNSETVKAIGFGATQGALLAFALATDNAAQERTSLTLLCLVYAYSVYDGWMHHQDIRPGMLQVRQQNRVQFFPIITGTASDFSIAIGSTKKF